jgi:transcriptional regulator with XRE-family HTH domain
MSQRSFAAGIGVSRGMVALVETGRARPSVEVFESMLDVLMERGYRQRVRLGRYLVGDSAESPIMYGR